MMGVASIGTGAKRLFSYLTMKKSNTIQSSSNSKGAFIFKKMLEDKKAIHQHLQKGGNFSELKEKFNFVKPLSVTGK